MLFAFVLLLCFRGVVAFNPGTSWRNFQALAAVKTDGPVLTWGDSSYGGSLEPEGPAPPPAAAPADKRRGLGCGGEGSIAQLARCGERNSTGGKAGQGRAGQGRAGQGWAGQGRAGRRATVR